MYCVFIGSGNAFHRFGCLDNRLPVVLAEMIKALNVIGQHQEACSDFRPVPSKSRIHAMLRHTLT